MSIKMQRDIARSDSLYLCGSAHSVICAGLTALPATESPR